MMSERQYAYSPRVKKEEDSGYLGPPASNAHTLTGVKEEVKAESDCERLLLSTPYADNKESIGEREGEEVSDRKEGIRDERFFKNNYGPSIREGETAKRDFFCRHAFKTDDPADYNSLKYWPERNDYQPYHYKHSDGSIFFRNPDQSTYYYNPNTRKSRYIPPEGGQEIEHYVTDVRAESERALYCFPCTLLDKA